MLLAAAMLKKSNRQIVNNYRPISLLPCISKVLERIVFIALFRHFFANRLFATCNSGFKPADSTINRLLILLEQIYLGLDKSKEIIMVLLDISKAFDRVWHEGLLFKLRQYGIVDPLLSWLKSYLTDRKQQVVVNGQCSPLLRIHAGVPQGSILGPLLFLVYINDMSHNLSLEIHQFADDTSLLEIIDNPNLSINKINNDLSTLSKWADQWRVTFNATKTHFIRISNKINRQILDKIYLDDIEITEVKSCVNLGLTINNSLDWSEHINNVCNKALKRIVVLNKNRFVLPRPALERLYLQMIRPVLEYGDIIYDNCTLIAGQSIENTQRKAALICTNAYKHTENKSLLQELGWESMTERRHKHKLLQTYKILNRIYPDYLYEKFLPRQNTTYNLRNTHQFQPRHSRLQSSYNSYFPSAIREWNALPDQTRNSNSLLSFKQKISPTIKSKLFNSLCYGKMGTQLTRLRLGLSALNAHRYTYNFIENPNCLHCNIPETVHHFFFVCPTYQMARQTLLNRLSNELLIVTNDESILLEIILKGIINPVHYNLLLNITCEFLSATKRFTR